MRNNDAERHREMGAQWRTEARAAQKRPLLAGWRGQAELAERQLPQMERPARGGVVQMLLRGGGRVVLEAKQRQCRPQRRAADAANLLALELIANCLPGLARHLVLTGGGRRLGHQQRKLIRRRRTDGKDEQRKENVALNGLQSNRVYALCAAEGVVASRRTCGARYTRSCFVALGFFTGLCCSRCSPRCLALRRRRSG